MEERYVISYDVGTSSVKAALIDTRLNIAAMSVHDYPIYHPQMEELSRIRQITGMQLQALTWANFHTSRCLQKSWGL